MLINGIEVLGTAGGSISVASRVPLLSVYTFDLVIDM